MRAQPTYREKVDFLKRPGAYPGRVRTVRCIETHFAWVFLAGRNAYKLKKPVRHKQMDYRTLAARKRGCFAELHLNRRFAPAVYREVVPLTMTHGHLALNGKGRPTEWLVRMRRLSEGALLDHALRGGTVRLHDIDRILRALIRIYEDAPAHPLSGPRYLARLTAEIRQNRADIARTGDRLTRALAQRVCDAQLAALAGLRQELAARGAGIVEGHGDLRAEHVYLGTRIAVIDALEFDAQLRMRDPAEEISLLALEIERLGYPTFAERLIEGARRHFSNTATARLFCFYRSHRAATRAKLAAWHIGDPEFPDAAPWIARTESLLEDALRYARAAGVQPLMAESRPEMQQRPAGRSERPPAVGSGGESGHMQFS